MKTNTSQCWNPNLIPQCGWIPNINDRRQTRSYYFKEMVSMSHVIGSISSFIVEYIKHGLHDDLIATTWNTMEELFSQRGHKFKEILSKPRPIMTIDPKFDPSDDSQFIPQREFDSWVSNDPDSDIWMSVRHSDPLIIGEGFELYRKLRRMKMDFNINFIFDSDIQRIQAQEYIRMNIRHMVPINIFRYIENNIPENFIDAIAKITGFDKYDERFFVYLNNRSREPITRKLRTGSQTMEFFNLQYTPLDIKFNDLPTTNGPVKRGNIVISSSFSESVTVEFVMDSMYFLKTPKKIPIPRMRHKDVMCPVGEHADKVIYDTHILGYIPYIANEEHDFVKLTTIVAQADKNGDDTVNLFHVLNGEIGNLIYSYKQKNKPIDFFHVAVLETPDHRIGGERIKFNQETMDLTIKDMDIYKSYYITLYIDKQKIHKSEMLAFETDKFGRYRDNEKLVDTKYNPMK